MTSMIADPQLMAIVAANVEEVGSVINAASTAATSLTTGLTAAAEDEVSALITTYFNAYAQQYHALIGQAAAFDIEFARLLTSAGNAYAQVEAASVNTLGALTTPVQSLLAPLTAGLPTPAYAPAAIGADPAVDAILVMSGSGTATPSMTFVNNVYGRYLTNFTGPLQAVSTAEGLYPFTGVKDLILNVSLARDLTELHNAIVQVLGPAPSTKSVSVLGYSQSAIVASLEMPKLLAAGYDSTNAYFTLLGNPANPNGGLFTRFPGLNLPSVGLTAGPATPSNAFPTTIWSLEYDGFADFPRYPINILADLNALAGIVFVHPTYSTLTPDRLSSAITLTQSGAPSMTTYYMIPSQNLPLLDPLRAIPGIGKPLADLVQPNLRYLINWGYGDPRYGWSTTPADVPTPFGVFPPPEATTSLGPLLINGTQQGFHDFATDLSAAVPTSLPTVSANPLMTNSLATAPLTMPTPTSIAATITGALSDVQSANNKIAGSFVNGYSAAYAVLLPTADIATALTVSLPSYNLDLFLRGITQAVNGDPAGGLINAFGSPLAADAGVITLAGGFQFIAILNALDTIITGAPHPGPN